MHATVRKTLESFFVRVPQVSLYADIALTLCVLLPTAKSQFNQIAKKSPLVYIKNVNQTFSKQQPGNNTVGRPGEQFAPM